ncbi:MAG TPA: MerR family transcriptional regulator [Herpetosiphonaceae bacterium]|nr:MerR family transcriptional regulator [Herpetosiphonaceae bacterium]
MFTVGDFARLAQVSKRLLRYYDEIGLFKPGQIDEWTGYRFYRAEQMSDLNRILALKELGLSLDQIRQTLGDAVSTAELQGMLMLKKAEIEQQLRAELRRIQHIESRLQAIRDDEANTPPNIIVKQIADQTVFSLRRTVEDFEMGMELYGRLQASIPPDPGNGLFFCICHSDEFTDRDLDMEVGIIAHKPRQDALALPNGLSLARRELPGAPMMATTIVKGALQTIHLGYAAITRWSGIHGYRLAGIPRELLLQLPRNLDGDDLVTEIQVPVEPYAGDHEPNGALA